MQVTTRVGYTKTDAKGTVALLAGSSLWGLFWIPLHYLTVHGMNPLWALVLLGGAIIISALCLDIATQFLAAKRYCNSS